MGRGSQVSFPGGRTNSENENRPCPKVSKGMSRSSSMGVNTSCSKKGGTENACFPHQRWHHVPAETISSQEEGKKGQGDLTFEYSSMKTCFTATGSILVRSTPSSSTITWLKLPFQVQPTSDELIFWYSQVVSTARSLSGMNQCSDAQSHTGIFESLCTLSASWPGTT